MGQPNVEVEVEGSPPTDDAPDVVVVDTGDSGSNDNAPPWALDLVERVTRMESRLEEVATQAANAEVTAEVTSAEVDSLADVTEEVAEEVAEESPSEETEETEESAEELADEIEPSREHWFFRERDLFKDRQNAS